MHNKQKRLLTLIITTLLITSCNIKTIKNNAPKAINGVLDLTNWDFEKENVELNGEWLFYWEEFIQPEGINNNSNCCSTNTIEVPKRWKNQVVDGKKLPANGYATHHLKVKLSPDLNKNLSFKFKIIATSNEIYINGTLVNKDGIINSSRDTMKPQLSSKIINIDNFLIGNDNTLEILILTSDFHYYRGGIDEPILLGLTDKIYNIKMNNILSVLFLCGSIFIMGIYHISLFFMNKKDKAVLYFGFVCLTTVIYALTNGDVVIHYLIKDINFKFFDIIYSTGVYIGVYLFIGYIYHIFDPYLPKRILTINKFVGIIYLLLTIILPIYITISFYNYWLIFVLVNLLFIIYLSIKRVIKKEDEAIMFFIGIIFFTTMIIIDLFLSLFHNKASNLVPYGIFIFFFIQAILLAKRFTESYNTVERLSKVLLKTNNSFKKFIPKEFLVDLKKDTISDIGCGEHITKTMTVLFIDIKESKLKLKERYSENHFSILDGYLEIMEPLIVKYQGFVDKYTGDAVMALFGDSESFTQTSADRAIKTAIEMRDELIIYNEARRDANLTPIEFSISVNTGELILALVGEIDKTDTTVIGDTVNISSKIESLEIQDKAPILFSDSTYKMLIEPEKYNIIKLEDKKQTTNALYLIQG